MADNKTAQPQRPLEGRMAGSPLVRIEPAEPANRLVLRARPEASAELSKALGVKLPQKPKSSEQSKAAKTKGRRALWIGPDEWLIIADASADLTSVCGKVSALHSAVDVSHRNTAITVSGPAAEATLNAGCPQDLSLDAFPVGACSRTLLGKAEVVLLRESEETFRVECWRSFSAYVFDFLADASRAPMI
ncbi:sarcosine oxidase subunit gamma [Hoeflea prorocentri]|uniref:Sarcosine oxidase subunit gamma n=1 Tax=Hoeflea prorocentri TaxID=1922333 RepID=A0A9X3ZFH4_9HYPH|nr:sarcosine oxidase subunit gamma [Hoeflea prorocentri]MCY6379213.1 sarcosine oxidase subunit gamma [Hoeflea prorocentri]MDA5397014.1 sarcosine oxidase subunit gamma [Hoeflea prorocentri]